MTERLHAHLARLQPIFARIGDCKRIRTAADAPTSFAGRRFATTWADLAAGVPVADIAVRETAAALVACELAGIDARALRAGGLDDAAIVEVLASAVLSAGGTLAPAWRDRLIAAVPSLLDDDPDAHRTAPPFVAPLQRQPRAGATHPREGRLILEPAESHADHAWAVAVVAALVTGDLGGDIAPPFLAGLGHHLHNAELPDAGFAGEELIGDRLGPLVTCLRDRALATLPAPLAEAVVASLRLLPAADSVEAMAFHAADVIDRVLEVVQFDRVARFRKEHALETLGLVHPGPLKSFQDGVLAATGLVPR